MSNDSEYVWTPLEDGRYEFDGGIMVVQGGLPTFAWNTSMAEMFGDPPMEIRMPEPFALCARHPAPSGGVPDALLQDAATRSLIVKGLERYKGDIQRAEASGWYDGFTVAQNEIARIDRTIDAILNATPAPPQPPYAIPPLSETIVTLHVENRGQGKPSGVLPQPLAPDQEGSS
jgi:hypothetical protein